MLINFKIISTIIMKENVRVRSGCENVQVIPQSLILRSEEWHNVEIDFWLRVDFESHVIPYFGTLMVDASFVQYYNTFIGSIVTCVYTSDKFQIFNRTNVVDENNALCQLRATCNRGHSPIVQNNILVTGLTKIKLILWKTLRC